MTAIRGWLLLALLLLPRGSALQAEAGERPNILWLVSEDNSVDYLRLYTAGGAPMPTVERLAAEGVVFNHAFSNAPVCSVARSTIISGSYVPRLLAQYHRRAAPVPLPASQRMFPAYLREAGYYTTNNRKEDYNFIKPADVWDESSRHATYRKRAPGQPFFHVQNFETTHESRLHFTAEQMAANPTVTDPATVPLFPTHPDTPLFRTTHALYRDLHVKLDAELGAFMQQLADDGLMEETIVFYYGDHGGVLPGSKGYLNERGLRVPMVIYVPKKWRHLLPTEAGSRIDGFVQFVDLGPTVLHLAGVAVPEAMDGRPFLGAGVTLDELNRRDTAYSYADRFDEKSDFVRALRRGKFKYVRSYQPFYPDALQNDYRYKQLAYQQWRELYRAGELNPAQRQFFEPRTPEALYDIEADPFELHNLAAQPDHAETLVQLRTQLHAMAVSLPDLSFYPESYLLEHAVRDPGAFADQHREDIARLVTIADLVLQPDDAMRAGVAAALRSASPWERYWALIVASARSVRDPDIVALARELAATDAHNLVRARAAEFLGLGQWDDPRPMLISCLQAAETMEEAGLILNTITLLHDAGLGYPLTLDRASVPAAWLANRQSPVALRFAYLMGE